MFNRFFKRKEQPAPAKDDWEQKLVWLPAGHPQNAFATEVLDCRSVALNFTSTTSDKSIAESFNRLRASNGRELIGRGPEDAIHVECTLSFPYSGERNDGPIFIAQEMEDKWDLLAYGNSLYVRRSWTGLLAYVARLEYSSNAVVVNQIDCDRNTAFNDPDLAVDQLHFIISTHLGRAIQPFPIPLDFPRTGAKAIALMGFGSYGRRAQFGAYLNRQRNV
jgi:hypothetical protein